MSRQYRLTTQLTKQMSKPATSKKHPRQINEEEMQILKKIKHEEAQLMRMAKILINAILYGPADKEAYILKELATLTGCEHATLDTQLGVHALRFADGPQWHQNAIVELYRLIEVDLQLRRSEGTRFAIELSDLTRKLGDRFGTPVANLVGQFATAAVTPARPLQPRTFRRSA